MASFVSNRVISGYTGILPVSSDSATVLSDPAEGKTVDPAVLNSTPETVAGKFADASGTLYSERYFQAQKLHYHPRRGWKCVKQVFVEEDNVHRIVLGDGRQLAYYLHDEDRFYKLPYYVNREEALFYDPYHDAVLPAVEKMEDAVGQSSILVKYNEAGNPQPVKGLLVPKQDDPRSFYVTDNFGHVSIVTPRRYKDTDYHMLMMPELKEGSESFNGSGDPKNIVVMKWTGNEFVRVERDEVLKIFFLRFYQHVGRRK